jgi:hypothetical protein
MAMRMGLSTCGVKCLVMRSARYPKKSEERKMASGTSTSTRTVTSTITKVVYVTRKVQADFLAILDTYGYFSEEYATQVIYDVRVLLDEEVIKHVHFIWTRRGSTHVLDEFRYTVVQGSTGLADDRPGGIGYLADLAHADFHVRLTYNERWHQLTEASRDEIRQRLQLRWGPAGTLDYTGGSLTADRTYSFEDLGFQRNRFIRR